MTSGENDEFKSLSLRFLGLILRPFFGWGEFQMF